MAQFLSAAIIAVCRRRRDSGMYRRRAAAKPSYCGGDIEYQRSRSHIISAMKRSSGDHAIWYCSFAIPARCFTPATRPLGFDDYFERTRARRAPESVVGVQNLIELEPMRDQQRRIDPVGLHGLQQPRCRDGVDQARRNADVL